MLGVTDNRISRALKLFLTETKAQTQRNGLLHLYSLHYYICKNLLNQYLFCIFINIALIPYLA